MLAEKYGITNLAPNPAHVQLQLSAVHYIVTGDSSLGGSSGNTGGGGSSSNSLAQSIGQAFDTASNSVVQAFRSSGSNAGDLVSSIDQAFQQLSSSVNSTLGSVSGDEMVLTIIEGQIAEEQFLLDELAQNLISSGQSSQASLDATLAQQALSNAKLQTMFDLDGQSSNNGLGNT